MSRVVNVVRMQLVNRQTFIWIPLLVLGGSYAVTYAIYAIIRSAGVTGPMYGGGAQAPLWYLGVVGVQALTFTFPFSQAMSVTRREFYLGTLLTAAIGAAILATVFTGLAVLENATDGLGMGGYFARLPFLWDAGPVVLWGCYATISAFAFVVGFAASTVYKRFGTLWLVVGLLTLAVVLVVALWAVTASQSWPALLSWFGGQGVGRLTLWGALVTVALAAAAFWPLRRAVP